MNNVFSGRLTALANMIEDGKVIYDVGCDHAYLDIYLMKYRHPKRCYAIDIRPSVMKIAQQNVKKYNVDIPVLCNNGLNGITLEENSVVVIAGMGTRNILKIIQNNFPEEMILQSNDDLFLLRQQLSNFGYEITDEQVVYEVGYYYVFIQCKKRKSTYTDQELLLGPILMKKQPTIYFEYLKYLLDKYERMIQSIPKEFPENREKIEQKKQLILQFLEN